MLLTDKGREFASNAPADKLLTESDSLVKLGAAAASLANNQRFENSVTPLAQRGGRNRWWRLLS